MYLSPWSLYLHPEDEISAALVWVRPPYSYITLSFWEKNYLRAIGNKLGRYIDQVDLKGNMHSCE
jgi:hypothetical protein